MYSNMLVVVLCVLGAVKAYHKNYNNDLRVIDSIQNESPCLSKGGMCAIAADCPTEIEERGLCPAQRSRGVECCYGISVKETRCNKRGGECMEGCNNPEKLATDCSKDAQCCILVK